MKLAQRKLWLQSWLKEKGYRDFTVYDAYLVAKYLEEIGQRGRVKYLKDGSIRCKRLAHDLRSLCADGAIKRLGAGKYMPLPTPPTD